MDISELLKGRKNCACGREHTCGIKHIRLGKGAINSLPALCENFNRIAVAADVNTYRVCGESVCLPLSDKLVSRTVLEAGSGGRLIPDETALERIKDSAVGADMLVGIGSGVINDICKYTAFTLGIPYIIVCTAPSMDGYASSGAALTLGGMKVTLPAREPYAIAADTDILVSAPVEMIRAGYGDILGKFSCLCDWKLSSTVNGEYFCQYVYDMTLRSAEEVTKSAEKLLSRDAGAIEKLMRALIEVGIGMAYIGNSRSASGSEHHISHFLEITGLLEGRECLLHGLDVGYASYMVQKLREKVLALKNQNPFAEAEKERTAMTALQSQAQQRQAQLVRIYGRLAPEVESLHIKTGFYDKDWGAVCRDKWAEICAVLEETPSSEQTEVLLSRAGYDIRRFYDFYGEKKLADAALFAKDLKDRFTFLWLYYELFSDRKLFL